MDMEPLRPTTTTRGRRQPAAHTDVEPKACATCRLAHVSCDREQPCGRCVRLGKTDSCQPPPTRKRGRPPRNKAPSPDDQQPPQEHAATLAVLMQAAASKRLCVRPKTSNRVVDPPGDSQPPHAALDPAAGSHCFSSTTTTSLSSSSLSPPPGQQRQQDSQEQEGLRSLLMLVVDQVREMRRENERLHDTIAQLQATQDEMRLEAEQRLRDTVAELLVGRRETKRRLKRVEQDQQQTRTEIERRLARVEQGHQTVQRRELAQIDIELNHTNRSGEVHHQVDQEFLPRIVQIALTPSPTPVSQPLWATGAFGTKHGRSVRVSAEHQVLFNQQRRMAQWGIVQVGSIEMGLDSTPLTTPSPSDIVSELTARANARVQLPARLPQALLKGRRSHGRVLTTTIRRAGAPDSHHQAFVEHGLVGELSTQESLTTGQQQQDETTTQQPAELRADAELEELIRVLGQSLSQRSSGVRSPQMVVGFSSTRPPPTPSSLAERWMRC